MSISEPRPEAVVQALSLATEVARRAGLDAAGAEVLRVRSSIHVALPRADVVARVEGPGEQDLALRQVLAARALAARDAPVARLFRPEVQPLLVGNRAVDAVASGSICGHAYAFGDWARCALSTRPPLDRCRRVCPSSTPLERCEPALTRLRLGPDRPQLRS